MPNSLKAIIKRQRETLQETLVQPLSQIAQECALSWGERETLDKILSAGFKTIPHCTFLYAVDTNGIQLSDNVSQTGLLPEHFGRDRSKRPYMNEAVPSKGFLLSEAYISLLASRPSLTALQVVHKDDKVVGFIGADFDLRNLPDTSELYEESVQWRQIKGDASIRSTVFMQTRTDSLFDQNIDQAISILEELIVERGMFQGVIHFSSSRATIWLVNDPYRYRILQQDELSDPDTCLAYPHSRYPADAVLPANAVAPVLAGMKALRFADENISTA